MKAVRNYIREVVAGFVTILVGMRITMREMLYRPADTIQYPEQKPVLKQRYRGMVFVNTDKCIACMACVKICPIGCITCEGEGKGKERHPSLYTLDFTKCLWCGLCTEVCPVDTVYMSHEYQRVFRDRKEMVVDFIAATKQGIVPDPLEEVRKAKREAERQARAAAAAAAVAAKAAAPKAEGQE